MILNQAALPLEGVSHSDPLPLNQGLESDPGAEVAVQHNLHQTGDQTTVMAAIWFCQKQIHININMKQNPQRNLCGVSICRLSVFCS